MLAAGGRDCGVIDLQVGGTTVVPPTFPSSPYNRAMTTAIDVRIEGMVQGVGFRYWTMGRAQELGLTGWVRNENDGDVTAHFEGDENALSEMIRALWKGPRWSRVTDVTSAKSRVRGCVSFELLH